MASISYSNSTSELHRFCESDFNQNGLIFDYIPEPNSNPSYLQVWDIEKSFSLYQWRLWFHNNAQYSMLISLVYLTVIFGLKNFMSNKKPLVLRKELFIWNSSLAIFSLLGTMRCIPEAINVFRENGLVFGVHETICGRDHYNVATEFWALLFVLSKAIELGDTVFIVLRKQPLIFLHWYHHVTVLCYTWLFYVDHATSARWFGLINYMIHSMMYSYYALKALRVKIPVTIAMTITFLQLFQMLVGIAVNVYALGTLVNGGNCAVSTSSIKFALGMYGSYLFLFGNFFYRAYFNNKKKTQ